MAPWPGLGPVVPYCLGSPLQKYVNSLQTLIYLYRIKYRPIQLRDKNVLLFTKLKVLIRCTKDSVLN